MNRKTKEEYMKTKFKNKEEIISKKLDLKNRSDVLKKQIQEARTKELELKNKLKAETIKNREEEKRIRKKTAADIKQEVILVNENNVILKQEEKILRDEIRLIEEENRSKVIESSANNKKKLMEIKRNIADQIRISKMKLDDQKSKIKIESTKFKKEIIKQKNKLTEFKITQSKILNSKRLEILEKKKELDDKIRERRQSARERRIKRLEDAKINRIELEKKRAKEKSNFKLMVQEIKGKYYDSQKIIEDEKEIDALKKNESNIKLNHIKASEKSKTDEVSKDYKTEISKDDFLQKNVEKNIDDYKLNNKPIEDIVINNNIDENINVINTNDIQGVILKEVGTRKIKIYNYLNKEKPKIKLKNIKNNNDLLRNVEEFEELNEKNKMANLYEIIKYAGFLNDFSISEEKLLIKLATIFNSMKNGKILKLLSGFFTIESYKSYKYLKYQKNISEFGHRVVTIGENNKLIQKIEETMMEKLKNGLIIKINNNIALKMKKNEIMPLNGLSFLK